MEPLSGKISAKGTEVDGQIEEKAEKTLRETETYRISVAIEVLAHRLNLAVQTEALGDHVAGMLVIEGDRGAIRCALQENYVKANTVSARKRATREKAEWFGCLDFSMA
jgi:hypothetical protein